MAPRELQAENSASSGQQTEVMANGVWEKKIDDKASVASTDVMSKGSRSNKRRDQRKAALRAIRAQTVDKASSSSQKVTPPPQSDSVCENNEIAIQCNICDEEWQRKCDKLKGEYDEIESVLFSLRQELSAVKRMAGIEDSGFDSESESSLRFRIEQGEPPWTDNEDCCDW